MEKLKILFAMVLAASLSVAPAFAFADNERDDNRDDDRSGQLMQSVRLAQATDDDDGEHGQDNSGPGNAGDEMNDDEDNGGPGNMHKDDEDDDVDENVCEVDIASLMEMHTEMGEMLEEFDDDDENFIGEMREKMEEMLEELEDEDCEVATSTPPVVVAPTINNITALPGVTTSTIAWTTDVPATGTVFFSTVNPLVIGATTTQSVTNAALSTGHSFTLSGLTASTTYIFVVRSTNAAGTTTSNQFSFTTTSTSSPPPPEQVTLTAAEVALHDDQTSCWLLISGNVYDVTDFIADHPDGAQSILENCGTEATAEFTGAGHSAGAFALLGTFLPPPLRTAKYTSPAFCQPTRRRHRYQPKIRRATSSVSAPHPAPPRRKRARRLRNSPRDSGFSYSYSIILFCRVILVARVLPVQKSGDDESHYDGSR